MARIHREILQIPIEIRLIDHGWVKDFIEADYASKLLFKSILSDHAEKRNIFVAGGNDDGCLAYAVFSIPQCSFYRLYGDEYGNESESVMEVLGWLASRHVRNRMDELLEQRDDSYYECPIEDRYAGRTCRAVSLVILSEI